MVFFSPQGEPLLNPYQVLDIKFGACDDEIGKAYKKLLLQLHPDKQPTDQSKEEAEEVSKRFHDVMGAKSFLLDGEYLASRREYDARLIAKEKANATVTAQKVVQQTARGKIQPQKQQQSAPAVPQSPSEKIHQASVTKAATKLASNKGDPQKADVNKKTDTSKKPGINKKQWGRVSRPSRRMNSSDPIKIGKKSSRSTTSEDSSSDDEGAHSGRIKSKKMTSFNEKHKSANGLRSKHHNKQKKSPSSSGKACKDSSKKASPKRSHPISSKGKPTSKLPSTKGSKLTDRKISNNKKASKIEYAKKQRSKPKSESTKDKLSSSCPSLCDEDYQNGKSTSFARKSSADGRVQGSDKPSKATPSWVPSLTKQPKATLQFSAAPKARVPSSFDTFQPAVESLTKQYLCPLTKEVMREPMTDFEGSSYERDAILKYLETHSTSPVTGNPLCPLHLTANSGLKERIQYTLKLKSCIDALCKCSRHALFRASSFLLIVILLSSHVPANTQHLKKSLHLQAVLLWTKVLCVHRNSVIPNSSHCVNL